MNFAKFLKTPFLTEHLQRLFLIVALRLSAISNDASFDFRLDYLGQKKKRYIEYNFPLDTNKNWLVLENI